MAGYELDEADKPKRLSSFGDRKVVRASDLPMLWLESAKKCHARFGIKAMPEDLDDQDQKHIARFSADKLKVSIIAAYGEAVPTDNANTFFDHLSSLRHTKKDKPAGLENFA